MTVKFAVISFLTLILVTSSGIYFTTTFLDQEPTPDEIEDVREMPWMSSENFEKYLKDYENKVSETFKVNSFYYPNVHFWFLIYTQFESNNVVIHDKNNLSLIYKVLDFSSLHKKNLSSNTTYILQHKIADEKLDALRDLLRYMADYPFSLEPKTRSIYLSLKHAGITLPTDKLERSAYFNGLRDGLRTQTGQKNFIREGLKRSLPYQVFLNEYFNSKNLPSELLAIPFLESSFNPRAYSKVGAAGIWQFMPFISGSFMPKPDKNIDYRSNVGVASISAAFLLEENYRIMKSWDLAVTAYNSGTKHLLKTKRELAIDNVRLEDVITHSDSKLFGFASKNFYSEFLALVHTIAYREEVFENLHVSDRYNVNDPLNFYLSKCSLKLEKLLTEKQLDDVIFHNNHLKEPKALLPKGLIVTAKEALPPKNFWKMDPKVTVDLKPKDWSKLIRNQSCSTR